MALSFKCPRCGHDVYSINDKIDDYVLCRYCETRSQLPETAVEADQEYAEKFISANPISRRELQKVLIYFIVALIIYAFEFRFKIYNPLISDSQILIIFPVFARIIVLVNIGDILRYKIGWPAIAFLILAPFLFLSDFIEMFGLSIDFSLNMVFAEIFLMVFMIIKIIEKQPDLVRFSEQLNKLKYIYLVIFILSFIWFFLIFVGTFLAISFASSAVTAISTFLSGLSLFILLVITQDIIALYIFIKIYKNIRINKRF